MSKFPIDLWDALNGQKGALDCYLETHNEQEVREHILALLEHQDDNETLRDKFAAQAMQGMLANSYSGGSFQPLSQATAEEIADMAWNQANAMLRARSQSHE